MLVEITHSANDFDKLIKDFSSNRVTFLGNSK